MEEIEDLRRALERARRAESEALAVCRLVAQDPIVRPAAAEVRLRIAALTATLEARLAMVAGPDQNGRGPRIRSNPRFGGKEM